MHALLIQTPDMLQVGKHLYEIEEEPLEALLNKLPPRSWQPKVFENPKCWRGYRAHWALHLRRLFLIDVLIEGDKNPTHGLRQLFRSRTAQVSARWFSGQIKCYFARDRSNPQAFLTARPNQVLTFDRGQLTCYVPAAI